MIRVVAALIGFGALAGGFAAVAIAPQERVIGAFGTSLAGRSKNQRYNCLLAASRLNGAQIPIRGELSFNARVGGFNRDAGFRKAPVSYNGQLIDSWGGGVCQASTALYNAALLSGLKILERHPHQFQPSYVPPGRDAAVSFGETDLRLANPYAYPVRVEARAEGDRLVVRLWSRARTPNVKVVESVSATQRPAQINLGDQSGSGKVRNSGKTGFEVEVFRSIDERVERVSRDHYPSMMRVVEYR